MEPNPELRPSVKEQMDNMFKLRDKLQRAFIHCGIAGLSFVVLSQITFPVAAPERYIEVARTLGQLHEPINWGLLALGFIGVGVAGVRMARMGMFLSRMSSIQEDLRSREQETS